MPLSSSSTLAEVKATYDDNAGYRESNSPTQAAAFIMACRILIRRTPSLAGHGNRQLQIDTKILKQALDEAVRWYASSGSNSGAVVTLGPDLDFRG